MAVSEVFVLSHSRVIMENARTRRALESNEKLSAPRARLYALPLTSLLHGCILCRGNTEPLRGSDKALALNGR